MKQIIIKPVITEKSYKDAQEGVYTFFVDKSANKIQIKEHIEKKFKVKVIRVRTVTTPGKLVTFGKNRKTGRRSDMKKAFVTLKKGDKIELFEV